MPEQNEGEQTVTDELKNQEGEGSTEDTSKTETKTTESTVTEVVEEQTVSPEELQELRTKAGLLKQAQTRLKELDKQHLDFGEVKASVTGINEQIQQQGETLNLVIDYLNQSAEGNEELASRAEANRKTRETQQQEFTQAKGIYTDILSKLQLVEISPDSEEAKPIAEAFNRKDYPKAQELTTQVCQAKVSALKVGKSTTEGETEEGDKDKDKVEKKQKVIVKSPSAGQDWRDLSRREKIKEGIAEARAEQ